MPPSVYDLMYGEEDPLDRLLREATRREPARATTGPKIPDYLGPEMTPEEEQSITDQLIGGSMGALQYVGETLDKPGRALRGILAGDASAIMNIIPFSDTMGLTDPADDVSGRDLLEKAGMVEENKPGLDFGDALGFVTEVGLDPLTYLGIGALTKSGKAAAKAGGVSKGLQKSLTKGERALAELRVPLVQKPGEGLMLGTGKKAQKFGKDVDDAMDYLRFKNPVGRTVGSMFDKTTMRFKTETMQRAAAARHAKIMAGETSGASEILNLDLEKGFMGDQSMTDVMLETATPGEKLQSATGFSDRDITASREYLDLPYVETTLEDGRKVRIRDPETEAHMRAQFIGDYGKGSDVPPGVDPIVPADPEFIKKRAKRWDAIVRYSDKIEDIKKRYTDKIESLSLPAFRMFEESVGHFPRFHTKIEADTFIRRLADAYTGVQDELYKHRKPFFDGQSTEDIERVLENLAGFQHQGRFWSYSPDSLHLKNTLKPGDAPAVKGAVIKKNAEVLELQDLKAKRKESGVTYDDATWYKDSTDLEGRKHRTAKRSLVKSFWDPETGRSLNGDIPFEDRLLRKVPDGRGGHRYTTVHEDASAINYDPVDNIIPEVGSKEEAVADVLAREFGAVNYRAASDAVKAKVDGYGRWLAQRTPGKYNRETNRFFNSTPAADLIARSQRVNRVAGEAELMTDVIRDWSNHFPIEQIRAGNPLRGHGKPMDYDFHVNQADGSEWMSVESIFKKTGHQYQVLDDTGAVDLKATAELPIYKLINTTPGMEGLSSMYIPKDAGMDMINWHTATKQDETVRNLLNVYDGAINAVKAGLTQMWPAFHIRNAMGGMYQNGISGATSYPAAKGGMLRDLWEANLLGRGELSGALKEIDGVPGIEGVTTWEALTNEMLGQGIWGTDTQATETLRLGAEIAEGVANTKNPYKISLDTMRNSNPTGSTAKAVAQFFDPLRPSVINKEQGVINKASKLKDTVIDRGQSFGNEVEKALRGAHYIARRRQGYTAAEAALSTKKWHFDYTAKGATAFERRYMKRMFPFYCVPDDSEVLTRDGWKTCDDLIVGEEILTYNADLDQSEWQPCQDKAIFDHDEELHVISNSRHTLRFTKGHRWPVRTTYNGSRSVIPWEDCNTTHSIIVSAALPEGGESLLTPEQARLLGWIVTDGSIRWKGNYCEAVVYQHPSKYLDEVQAVAGGNPRAPHPDSGVVCVPVELNRKNEIVEYLDKDNLVNVVTRLDRESAEAMYDAMYKADGVTKEPRTQDFMASQHPGVRSAFRVLAALLGKRTSESDRGAYVSHRRYMKIAGLHKEIQHYKGRVWCPSTDNGTWLMRQGGQITFSGNTFMRNNLPLTLTEIAKNPGGAIAQSIRAGNATRTDAEFVPSYVGDGIAAQLPEWLAGKDAFLSGTGLPFEEAFERFSLPSSIKPDNIAQAGTRTLQKFLSSSTPAVRVPVELATEKVMFTGRDFSDTYPYPTNYPHINTLFSGSPLSRAGSTFRKLAIDDRKTPVVKALDFFTGLKFTNVKDGLEGQKHKELAQMWADRVKHNPNIADFPMYFVPESQRASLSDEERLLMQYHNKNRRQAQEARRAAQ